MAFTKKSLVVILTVAFLVGIFTALIGLNWLPDTIEAMKAIITADAAVIGFTGVVTIFILTSIQNEYRRIEDSINRENDAYHNEQLRFNSENRSPSNDYLSNKSLQFMVGSDKQHNARLSVLYGKLSKIAVVSNETMKVVTCVVALLTFSILCSIIGMNTGILKNLGSTCGLFSMEIAFFFLLLAFWNYYQLSANLQDVNPVNQITLDISGVVQQSKHQ